MKGLDRQILPLDKGFNQIKKTKNVLNHKKKKKKKKIRSTLSV